MPFTPIIRGIEVAFHGHNATGQEIINVYHFRTQGPGVTPLDVLTVAQYMATNGWTGIRQALSSAYTADFVIGRDISVLGAALDVPVLVVHDEHDPVVPLTEAQRLMRSLKNVRLEQTSGLGHSRILSAAPVKELITRFISESHLTSTSLEPSND